MDDRVGLPAVPPLSLVWAAACVTGLVREGNEDSLYAGRRLLAVADGMGGHAAGEVASAAVIASLRAQDREVAPGELLKFLARAVEDANAEVARRAAEAMSRFGMGTTLTALLWSGRSFALVHVGDSRGFRLRDGCLRQMTEDHVLGKLVSNAGWMASMLTRYLDGRPDLSPDFALHELRQGDRYLLCSDGLSPVVSDTAIRDVLAAAAGPREAAGWLVALAEEAGGPDNISVIVADVRDAADEPVVPEPVVLGAAAAELLPC